MGRLRDLGFADFYKAVGACALRSASCFFLCLGLSRPPGRAGPHFAACEATASVPELVASAHGVVIELGPGIGIQVGGSTRRA